MHIQQELRGVLSNKNKLQRNNDKNEPSVNPLDIGVVENSENKTEKQHNQKHETRHT
jgi:hypothetical protein